MHLAIGCLCGKECSSSAADADFPFPVVSCSCGSYTLIHLPFTGVGAMRCMGYRRVILLEPGYEQAETS